LIGIEHSIDVRREEKGIPGYFGGIDRNLADCFDVEFRPAVISPALWMNRAIMKKPLGIEGGRKTKMKRHRTIPLGLLFAASLANPERLLCAQGPALAPDTKTTAGVPGTPRPKIGSVNSGEHRFWDKTNGWLFTGVAASRTLDYFSTLNMRRRGRQEILLTNEVVDNHAAFVAIEAAGTSVSIGASYLFHRYGHHKLERWTSIVHIGLATTGVVRNYSLKTYHSGSAHGP
jgi:hypothetical protein